MFKLNLPFNDIIKFKSSPDIFNVFYDNSHQIKPSRLFCRGGIFALLNALNGILL